MLKYLLHSEIDKVKWNHCINKSNNALLYAEAEYLDALAVNWDALVLNDYESVMPLCWKSKWGIKYLYQPTFVQQSGIFSTKPLSDKAIQEFINAAAMHFKFAEISLNYSNLVNNLNCSFIIRNNFILSLEGGYEITYNNYKPYIRERLNRLKKFNMKYQVSDDTDGAIKLYQQTYGGRFKGISNQTFERFKNLCNQYQKKQRAFVREVREDSTQELLAIVLLIKDEKRIYNLASTVTEKGKKLLANYFLYDKIFQEFSAQGLCFDFEGSDLPGVSYFYEKFADNNQSYPFVKWNNLPWPLKIFKR